MGLTAADLRYDDASHRSWLPNGDEVPHVTAVLSETGISEDFEALALMGERQARSIEAARDLGLAVHADCHAYDDDDLDLSACDARVRPYVKAWAECRAALGLVPVVHARERRIFHPLHCYTGRLDGVFARGRRYVLGDLKIGDPEAAGCSYQTAAYAAAWELEHPDSPLSQRLAIRLCPGLRIPYRIDDYMDPRTYPSGHLDFNKFLAFLTTYRHQYKRR